MPPTTTPSPAPLEKARKSKKQKTHALVPEHDADAQAANLSATVAAETPRKKARVSFAEILEAPPSVPTFMTKGELKQKHSALSGKKKKDKIVSSGGGSGRKSAKDAILGRKPGRS